jgi:hypothetical protein
MMAVVLEENEGGKTDKDKRVQSYTYTHKLYAPVE